MGRKRVIKTQEIVDVPAGSAAETLDLGEAQISSPTPEEVKEERDINRFLTSFGGEGMKVRIYRKELTGTMAFLTVASPENVSEEMLAEQFGRGKYECRLFDSQRNYVTCKSVNIGSSSPTPEENASVGPGGRPRNNPPETGNLQIDMLRAELAANREIMLELVRGLAGKENGSNAQGSTLSEFATAMSALKEVVKPAEGPSPFAMVTDLIGVLKQGIELGASGAIPGEKKEGGWMGLVKDVLQVIPSLTGVMKANAGGTAESAAPVMNGTGSPVVSPAPNPLALSEDHWRQFHAGIEYLKTRCRLGKDPSLWADVILENLDQDYYVQLAKLSALSIDEVSKALEDKEIAEPPFRTWFEALLKGVKDALAENTAGGGEGRDAPNSASDAGTGESKPV